MIALAQSAVLERQGSAIADSPGYGKKADPDFGGGESLQGQSSRFNLGLGLRGHDVVRPHFEKVVRTLAVAPELAAKLISCWRLRDSGEGAFAEGPLVIVPAFIPQLPQPPASPTTRGPLHALSLVAKLPVAEGYHEQFRAGMRLRKFIVGKLRLACLLFARGERAG